MSSMEIGIVSDTHGFFDPNLVKIFSDVDEIWHAGDFGAVDVANQLAEIKPLRGVFGNIDTMDIRQTFPEDLQFEIAGVQVWMTHIAGRPNRYEPRVKKQLASDGPDMLVCGHSHLLRVERDKRFNDMLYLNPGAAGHHGAHQKRTVMKCRIANGKVGDLRVIELGPRGRLQGRTPDRQ